MNKRIKKWLTGISIPQEYVCVGLQDIDEPLTVIATCSKRGDLLDVTRRHVFLGYKPVVMAIVFSEEEAISDEMEVCLSLSDKKVAPAATWNGFYVDEKSVARLSLCKIDERHLGHSKIVFYRGVKGKHCFISAGHQRINNLLDSMRKRPQSNVGLNGNLYEQVRIAYSIPRVISMITVFDGNAMNLFPTDLHGPAGKDFYLSSLRIGGEACRQVEQTKRIVISEVASSAYRMAYGLGKQHMRPMSATTDFDLSEQISEIFKFPLPAEMGRYCELEVIDHVDEGIHRVFIYKIINEHSVQNFNPLSHIHCYYAQWRSDHGLATKYLLRH